MKTFSVFFIGFIVGMLCITYNAFAWGFVFYKFYHWFVMPTIFFAPKINYSQAIGLMMVISLFQSDMNTSSYKDAKGEWWFLFSFAPWLSLIIGYVFHLFL